MFITLQTILKNALTYLLKYLSWQIPATLSDTMRFFLMDINVLFDQSCAKSDYILDIYLKTLFRFVFR